MSDTVGQVARFLDAHHVAHLATVGDGGPHAAPVFFARIEGTLDIVWISAPDVVHSRHLASGARMALSVSPSCPPLERIEGVQMRGFGGRAADQESAAAAYFARFPAVRAMESRLVGHEFYRFRPDWVRIVVGFGGEVVLC